MTDSSGLLRIVGDSVPRSVVIVLHGSGARGSVHHAEAHAFAVGGVEVLLPDAPGHGARADGRMDRIAALPDERRRHALLAIARQWSEEVRELGVQCRERGAERVALVGISMGGFAALAALAEPCPFAAIAALLAAPDLVDRARITPGRPPLMLGLAGRDEAVPPEPAREFAAGIGAELWEYPESGHLMRGEDWQDLWQRVAVFLRRHLA